jgi:hypothetical protein
VTSSHTTRASHTPGPWIADSLFMHNDRVVRISAYDGTPDYYHRCMDIAECFVRDSRHDKDAPHVLQAEANARLIAAAPALLEALQMIVDTYCFDSSTDSAIWQTAFGALAMATGNKSDEQQDVKP